MSSRQFRYSNLPEPVPTLAPLPEKKQELKSLFLGHIPRWVDDDDMAELLANCGINNEIKRIDYNDHVRYKSGVTGIFLLNKALDQHKECYVHFKEPLDKNWEKAIDTARGGRLQVHIRLYDRLLEKSGEPGFVFTFRRALRPVGETLLNKHQMAARIVDLEDKMTEMQANLYRQENLLKRYEILTEQLAGNLANAGKQIRGLNDMYDELEFRINVGFDNNLATRAKIAPIETRLSEQGEELDIISEMLKNEFAKRESTHLETSDQEAYPRIEKDCVSECLSEPVQIIQLARPLEPSDFKPALVVPRAYDNDFPPINV